MTVRTNAELQTIYADNTSGDVPASAGRDMADTLFAGNVVHLRKTFTNADILSWTDDSTPEILPAVAGKYYRLIAAAVRTKIITPYGNKSGFRELQIGYDNFNYAATTAIAYAEGAGAVWSGWAQSSWTTLFPAKVINLTTTPTGDTAPWTAIGEKNLSLYFYNNGNGPLTGGHADNFLRVLLTYVQEDQ